MINQDDEYLLDFISEQVLRLGLNGAFIVPLVLVAFFNTPTYVVWMISNFVQMMELLSYLQITLPGNVI